MSDDVFESVIGQKHLIGLNGPIKKILENDNAYSIIFHGPPGIGKTTLANIIASKLSGLKVSLNATNLSKNTLKEAVDLSSTYERIIIIIDEIHMLDKAKQDFLLPYLEKENFIIIGTTTENPYYDVRGALRSRMIIFELFKPTVDDITNYIECNLTTNDFKLDRNKIEKIITLSAQDVRQTLNMFNFLKNNYEIDEITNNLLSTLFMNNVVHDKSGDYHYNLLSALQKSIRASDVNATLHYTGRLITTGDFKNLFRRLIVIAYEDIGVANPQLCSRVIAAKESFDYVGMPEGRIIISTLVVDMALSAKSNAAYKMLDSALLDIKEKNIEEINEYIKINQKKGYEYSPEKVKYMDLLPNKLQGKNYYFSNDASKYENALKINYVNRCKRR